MQSILLDKTINCAFFSLFSMLSIKNIKLNINIQFNKKMLRRFNL